MTEQREFSAAQILDWSRAESPVIRVRIPRDTPFGHAMLRFIFKADRRPVILDQEGLPLANDSEVSDLVLSWEAWRPPEASFDPLKGLDPSTYALTPRLMVGAVRCLCDAILNRPWHCYTLKLPEVEHAHDEMLYSCFALADAVARQTVSHLIDQRIGRGQKLFADYSEALDSEWDAIGDYSRGANLPEEPIRDVLDGKISYQLLERSCITMALLCVDWGNHRIHRRAGLPEPRRVEVAPGGLPSFISELVSGERTPLLLRIPAALHWVLHNQTVVVEKAPRALADIGLLERRLGRPARTVYDNRRNTPYGPLLDHIIY